MRNLSLLNHHLSFIVSHLVFEVVVPLMHRRVTAISASCIPKPFVPIIQPPCHPSASPIHRPSSYIYHSWLSLHPDDDVIISIDPAYANAFNLPVTSNEQHIPNFPHNLTPAINLRNEFPSIFIRSIAILSTLIVALISICQIGRSGILIFWTLKRAHDPKACQTFPNMLFEEVPEFGLLGLGELRETYAPVAALRDVQLPPLPHSLWDIDLRERKTVCELCKLFRNVGSKFLGRGSRTWGPDLQRRRCEYGRC